MKWKFAFGLASDDLFFVTTKCDRPGVTGVPLQSKITVFLDEDEFLGHLIRAGLSQDQTTSLALAVLLSIAKPVSPPPWTRVDLTQKQMEMLHLYGSGTAEEEAEPPSGKDLDLPAARSGALPQFYNLLMQAPTAIAMVVGREHRFTFLNTRYAALVGIKSPPDALGKTMLELFPELDAHNVIRRFDRVYESGIASVENEAAYTYHPAVSGTAKDRYFNTVCQPITNVFGEVSGLLLQATDVTEMVLAHDVRENREQLLYQQWAELDTIYRNVPVGLLLLDTKDFRILRLNERQAEIIGASVAELLGMPVLEMAYEIPGARELLERAMAGDSAANQLFEGRLLSSPDVLRHWLVSVTPAYSASGMVETIMLVSHEISREVSPVTPLGVEASIELAVMV